VVGRILVLSGPPRGVFFVIEARRADKANAGGVSHRKAEKEGSQGLKGRHKD